MAPLFDEELVESLVAPGPAGPFREEWLCRLVSTCILVSATVDSSG